MKIKAHLVIHAVEEYKRYILMRLNSDGNFEFIGGDKGENTMPQCLQKMCIEDIGFAPPTQDMSWVKFIGTPPIDWNIFSYKTSLAALKQFVEFANKNICEKHFGYVIIPVEDAAIWNFISGPKYPSDFSLIELVKAAGWLENPGPQVSDK